jgi:hypothetical protein
MRRQQLSIAEFAVGLHNTPVAQFAQQERSTAARDGPRRS